MLTKTRGIALHTIKYSESSLVAYVYTEQFGRQSYLVKGAYSKNATVKASLFQPLALLDMDVYHKPNGDLQKIKEALNVPPFASIPFSPVKNTISLFLAEVVYRSVREEHPNPFLFSFLHNAIQLLDHEDRNIGYFHLVFLLQLSKHLGFYPQNNYSTINSVFDIVKGNFTAVPPIHGQYLAPEYGNYLSELMHCNFAQMHELNFSREVRNTLLETFVAFMGIHSEGMGSIKSLRVLNEVFNS
jgi:DNA repair protein RecO (recombination protein O)